MSTNIFDNNSKISKKNNQDNLLFSSSYEFEKIDVDTFIKEYIQESSIKKIINNENYKNNKQTDILIILIDKILKDISRDSAIKIISNNPAENIINENIINKNIFNKNTIKNKNNIFYKIKFLTKIETITDDKNIQIKLLSLCYQVYPIVLAEFMYLAIINKLSSDLHKYYGIISLLNISIRPIVDINKSHKDKKMYILKKQNNNFIYEFYFDYDILYYKDIDTCVKEIHLGIISTKTFINITTNDIYLEYTIKFDNLLFKKILFDIIPFYFDNIIKQRVKYNSNSTERINKELYNIQNKTVKISDKIFNILYFVNYEYNDETLNNETINTIISLLKSEYGKNNGNDDIFLKELDRLFYEIQTDKMKYIFDYNKNNNTINKFYDKMNEEDKLLFDKKIYYIIPLLYRNIIKHINNLDIKKNDIDIFNKIELILDFAKNTHNNLILTNRIFEIINSLLQSAYETQSVDYVKLNKKLDYLFDNINTIKESEYNLSKIINNPTIPVVKNPENKVESDILIVSYNEANRKYDSNDCLLLVNKIIDENPIFIFVGTQESSVNLKNFQNILSQELDKINYKLIAEDSGHITEIKGKNVRSKLYLNQNSIIKDKSKNNKLTNALHKSDFLDEPSKSKNNKDIIKYVNTTVSKESGLGSLITRYVTFYKGSIMTELVFNYKGIDQKFIVVNSHLYYTATGNTGVHERRLELLKLIREFELVGKNKDGYNIFFCGDLNFRLGDKSTRGINENIIANEIIEEYLKNNSEYKKNSSNNLKLNNELYKYLNNPEHYLVNASKPNTLLKITKNSVKSGISKFGSKIGSLFFTKGPEIEARPDISNIKKKSIPDITYPEIIFFKTFKESINHIGTHLTSKYKENQVDKNINFYKYKKIDSRKTVFDLRPPKDDIMRMPSSTDRILYSLGNPDNIIISPYNFDIYVFPDKSDHKMITLSMELCEKSNRETLLEIPSNLANTGRIPSKAGNNIRNNIRNNIPPGESNSNSNNNNNNITTRNTIPLLKVEYRGNH